LFHVCGALSVIDKCNKIKVCEIKIAAACIEDLLHSEFRKGRLLQNVKSFNLYITYLIELVIHDETIERNLERIILSAEDMNVISDYYYLVATLLRLKVLIFI
jgi:hypothetical protein